MIENALISTQDGCTYIPEPKLPENPYNREPFNYFEYLKIWTKFKDLNIKSTIFQLFYEADFNLNCFKNRNSKMLFDLSFDRFFSRLSPEEFSNYYYETMEHCQFIYNRKYLNRPSNTHFRRWTLTDKSIENFDQTKFRGLVKQFWLYQQKMISSQKFINWMKNFFTVNSHYLTKKSEIAMSIDVDSKVSFLEYYKHSQAFNTDITKSKNYYGGYYHFAANPYLVFTSPTKQIDLSKKLIEYYPKYRRHSEQFKDLRDSLEELYLSTETEDNKFKKLKKLVKDNNKFFKRIKKIRKFQKKLSYLYQNSEKLDDTEFVNPECKRAREIISKLIEYTDESSDSISTIKGIIEKKFRYTINNKYNLQRIIICASDISLVAHQAGASLDEAELALINQGGDIINALMEFM